MPASPHHPLLARQLKKLALAEGEAPTAAAFARLVAEVDAAYSAADLERERFERSAALSELEMQAAFNRVASERAHFRAVFDSAALGIAILEPDGSVAQCNAAFAKMAGYELSELEGMSITSLNASKEQHIDLSGPAALFECSMRRKSGEIMVVEVAASAIKEADGSVVHHVVVLDDVTERRQLAFELRQAQKLETVGRLASGIAHEINTPIQFVGDSVAFMRDAFADIQRLLSLHESLRVAGYGPRALAQIAQVEEEIDLPFLVEELPRAAKRSIDGLERVATIVRAMKEFAHPEQTEQIAVDLASAIQSTLTIAKNEYKYVADVETELAPLPPVTCCVGELNQAILNMVVNASHAIGDVVGSTGQRGKITVRLLREGDDAVISIADTGKGMPDDVKAKIFDPFFTTKPVGKGTGQGLAIAHNVVVNKHGGRIEVESTVGVGTTFRIAVPIGGKPAHKEAA
jgi:PAS domain S-box-containing protein